MEFLDYLSFIQVSIAFNFASAFWKKEGKDDAIEEMFGHLYDEKELEDGLNNNLKLINEIERFRPIQIPHEEDPTEMTMKQYHVFKTKWEHITQQILNIYREVMSKDRSTFFNDVCLFLGLYGLFQLCLLPDIAKSDFIVWRHAYIYSSEILLVVLFLLLIGEIVLRHLNIRFNSKISRLFSILFFGVIVLISWLLSIAYSYFNDNNSLFKLWISEDLFIYLTIYITYISYIVYFVVLFFSYLKDRRLIKKVIPKLNSNRERLLNEYIKKMNKG